MTAKDINVTVFAHSSHTHQKSYKPHLSAHFKSTNDKSMSVVNFVHASPLADNSTSRVGANSKVTSGASDAFFVFLGLAFISLVLYLTFHYLWKKHRKRSIATLYKIDEYRYSRLSQNEADGDNAVLYGDPTSQDQLSDEEEQCKPATLLIEPVPLVAISHSKSNPNNVSGAIFTATSQTNSASASSPKSDKTATLILQDSDEDLLQ